MWWSIAQWAINRQLSSEIQLLSFCLAYSPCKFLQIPKEARLLVLLLRQGELHGEHLVALVVLPQLPVPFPQKQQDNSMMVQSMDPWLSECHIPYELCICIPSHAVIWLGLMPLSPPPLPPGPLRPSSLLLTWSLDKFPQPVNKINLIE